MIHSLSDLARATPVLGASLKRADEDRRELARLLRDKKAGYCHCCRQETLFESIGDWDRDDYLCGLCFSIPRQRHLQMILDTYFPGWENASLHESSPSNDFLSRYSSAYSDSQFFEDAAPGTRVGGVRNENLEKMTFDDNTFDLFITQDVFEHVLNPQVAAKEILRVLKPGGAHIFTTPKHRTIEMSRTRVERVEGKIEDLFVPEFHGNPVGDGRSLVTWDYGRDFEELFTAWSGGTTVTYVTRDRSLGLEGEFLEVFVNRKPSR